MNTSHRAPPAISANARSTGHRRSGDIGRPRVVSHLRVPPCYKRLMTIKLSLITVTIILLTAASMPAYEDTAAAHRGRVAARDQTRRLPGGRPQGRRPRSALQPPGNGRERLPVRLRPDRVGRRRHAARTVRNAQSHAGIAVEEGRARPTQGVALPQRPLARLDQGHEPGV